MIDCRWLPLDSSFAVQRCLRCQRHLKVPVRAGDNDDDGGDNIGDSDGDHGDDDDDEKVMNGYF